MARSEMTRHSFIVLSNYDKDCFGDSSCKLCPLITPQTHPGHGRCVASWNFICVWFRA